MADRKDVRVIGQELKDSGVIGPQRPNEVNVSTGSFGGVGINYNRSLDSEGKFSIGGGVGTGGILGDAPSATIRADYRPFQGNWNTGTSLGTVKGELGAAILGAAGPDAAAGAVLATGRVTHVNSGINASLDLGAAAVSLFDDQYRSHQPYASGVAIFSVGKSF